MQLMKQIIFKARQQPDEPAVATASNIVSYATLAKSVASAVERLGQVRIEVDSTVLIDVADPLQHLYLVIAVGLMGLPSASLVQHAHAGDFGRAGLLLTDRGDTAADAAEALRVDAGWFAADRRAPASFDRLLAMPGYASPQSVARYMVSSGTTGRPKVIGFTADVLERRMLTSTVLLCGGERARAATLSLMEISTIAGYQNAVRTLCSGGLLCLAHNVASAIDLIRLFNVEVVKGSAGQFLALLRMLQGKPALSSIRAIYVTGARLTPAGLLGMQAMLCSDIRCGYASTEAGVMAVGTPEDLRRANGAVGYLVPGIELQAVDASDNPLPAGEEGMLRVRTGMAAFYRDPSGERLDVMQNGWLKTGDIGRVHADGLLTITGRVGEVINRGGVITAPDFIEEGVRAADPRIRDAAAVGVTNGNGSEEVWAAIVADIPLDPVELLQRSRNALGEKAPDRIVQVHSIPRNENAKIQRHLVREQLIAAAARRTARGR